MFLEPSREKVYHVITQRGGSVDKAAVPRGLSVAGKLSGFVQERSKKAGHVPLCTRFLVARQAVKGAQCFSAASSPLLSVVECGLPSWQQPEWPGGARGDNAQCQILSVSSRPPYVQPSCGQRLLCCVVP